ncbi:ABC-F family ATP-binding cassette domain-containing protein [Spirosoma fluminis]
MSIVAKSLAYIHPDREVLFHHIGLTIPTATKAALVGNNGSGKSTVLQLVAGRLQPAEGEISLSGTVYYVPQHLGQYDANTVAQALGVQEKLNALHAILGGDASSQYFVDLDDDWDIEERVQSAFAYWHLKHIDLAQRMDSLSGGEKTKVFLAGIAIHEPAIVLLDEPSNHLDSASRDLLYAFITQRKETMLVVSHDRALLNQLDMTLELSKSGIEVYGGNYDFYQAQKEGKLAALHDQLDEQAKTLKQARQKARDVAEQRQKQEIRGKAHGQKQGLPRIVAGGLQRKAEQSTAKLKDVQTDKINDITDHLQQIRSQIQEHLVLALDFRKSDLHKGKVLVKAKAINFAYSEHNLWPYPLTFQIRSGDRIRITGNNGSGKTTLLKLMTGSLQPSEGTLFRADFQPVYIDQEYSHINNQRSLIEQVEAFNSRLLPEHELKTLLVQHQFPRESWDRSCAGLSGGEKMKLLLCCLAVSTAAPDVLILDEPTNNLDVLSQEILTKAIKDFNGTVLVISHDQYFVDEIGVDSTIRL